MKKVKRKQATIFLSEKEAELFSDLMNCLICGAEDDDVIELTKRAKDMAEKCLDRFYDAKILDEFEGR